MCKKMSLCKLRRCLRDRVQIALGGAADDVNAIPAFNLRNLRISIILNHRQGWDCRIRPRPAGVAGGCGTVNAESPCVFVAVGGCPSGGPPGQNLRIGAVFPRRALQEPDEAGK